MRHTVDIKAFICSKTNMYLLLIFHCLLLEHNLRNLGKSMLGGQIKHEKKAQISGRAKCIYLSTKQSKSLPLTQNFVSCIGSVQLTRPIKMKYLIVLAVLLFAENVRAEAKIPEREGKFCNTYIQTILSLFYNSQYTCLNDLIFFFPVSMFNIVRFPNDACDAGGSRNGTCYTK